MIEANRLGHRTSARLRVGEDACSVTNQQLHERSLRSRTSFVTIRLWQDQRHKRRDSGKVRQNAQPPRNQEDGYYGA